MATWLIFLILAPVELTTFSFHCTANEVSASKWLIL